jgi:hypothetical protein
MTIIGVPSRLQNTAIPATTKVILVIVVLLIILSMILLAVLAPWLGSDTSDDRSEAARPVQGWYPGLPIR